MRFATKNLLKAFVEAQRDNGYLFTNVKLSWTKQKIEDAVMPQYYKQKQQRDMETVLKGLPDQALRRGIRIEKNRRAKRSHVKQLNKVNTKVKTAFDYKDNYKKYNDELRHWKIDREIVGSLIDGQLKLIKKAISPVNIGLQMFNNIEMITIDEVIERYTEKNVEFLRQSMNKLGNCVKFRLTVIALYSHVDSDGQTQYFRYSHHGKILEVLNDDDVELAIEKQNKNHKEELDNDRGVSGQNFLGIVELYMKIDSYDPMAGGSYLKTPDILKNKGVVNVKTKGDLCFKYACYATLIQVHNSDRMSCYDKAENKPEIDFSKMTFPVKCNDLTFKNFESRNPNYSLNVFMMNHEAKSVSDVRPLYVSNENNNDNKTSISLLLMYGNNENGEEVKHFVGIRNIQAFFRKPDSKNNELRCLNCLQRFCSQYRSKKDVKIKMEEHFKVCQGISGGAQKVSLPPYGSTLQFKDFQWLHRLPYVAYLDFEASDNKMEQNGDADAKTVKLSNQKGNSYTLIVVDMHKKVVREVRYNEIEDEIDMPVAEHCITELKKIAEELQPNINRYPDHNLTGEEEASFQEATKCYMCGDGDFDNTKIKVEATDKKKASEKLNPRTKVRDHCHFTGKYRGCAHSMCNLKCRVKNELPVFIHNGKNYDNHLLIKALQNFEGDNINVIAQNQEKFISFGVGFKPAKGLSMKITFKDSCAMLTDSLANLVAYTDVNDLTLTKAMCEQNGIDFRIATTKGLYPYEWMDKKEKFDAKSLPPQSAFYSTLKGESITYYEYLKAKYVWRKLKCKTFKDYHNFYLKTDVYLLADVFENFREFANKDENYGLDPAHAFTMPGYSWRAFLKMTKVEIDLLSDIDMYQAFEQAKRGGVCCVMDKLVESNVPKIWDPEAKPEPLLKKPKSKIKWISDKSEFQDEKKRVKKDIKKRKVRKGNFTANPKYDSTKPAKHVRYDDANNLYGWAMIQKLPVENFQWQNAINWTVERVMKMDDNGKYGAHLCVDLEYPKELHDKHADFPLCPEVMEVEANELSNYSQAEEMPKTYKPCKKLVPTLRNKSKYWIHYRNLKFALKHGLKLTKVHKVITYNQEDFMKKYIDFNTAKRAEAKNEFEKNMFKLMNNSVFGKTMENVRTRRDISLKFAGTKLYKKIINNPLYKGRGECIGGKLYTLEKEKSNIELSMPIFIGASILDLSKLHMQRFWYEFVRPMYPQAKLNYTDTDSFIYSVETEEDLAMKFKGLKGSMFDTSGYPKEHPANSDEQKKQLGYFKDEADGLAISYACCLSPKSYSMGVFKGKACKKLKGTSKIVVKKEITEADYRETLINGKISKHSQHRLTSKNHEIYMLKQTKTSLNRFDSKRFWLDKYSSLPIGHYRCDEENAKYQA